MEIVTEDRSCYCFRKSVPHLPGSITSFWQAYPEMKTELKCYFPLSFFILCICSSSDEECFQSCGVWYSVQSKEDATGSPSEPRNGASHTEKSYPHRELQRMQNSHHCPAQAYSCSGLPDQFKPVIPWSYVILLLKILHLCYQSYNYRGEVLPSLDTFGPISCCMVSAFFLCHLFLLSILCSIAIM